MNTQLGQAGPDGSPIHPAPSAFDVVAVAASAGGLQALATLFSGMPESFGAAIVVVQHLDRRYPSHLVHILSSRTKLTVIQARSGIVPQPGNIYIAPPDQHLLIHSRGSLALTHTDLVNYVRPAADILFESVALCYQSRAIAIVLTGTGHDGTMGISAIKKAGGVVIVQDQASSEFFGMPGSAIATGQADFVLPLEAIAATLLKLLTSQQP